MRHLQEAIWEMFCEERQSVLSKVLLLGGLCMRWIQVPVDYGQIPGRQQLISQVTEWLAELQMPPWAGSSAMDFSLLR